MAPIHHPKRITMAKSSAHLVASIHLSPTAGDPAVASWVYRLFPLRSIRANQRIFLTSELYMTWCLLIYLHNNMLLRMQWTIRFVNCCSEMWRDRYRWLYCTVWRRSTSICDLWWEIWVLFIINYFICKPLAEPTSQQGYPHLHLMLRW
jgi:hypothetical protein